MNRYSPYYNHDEGRAEMSIDENGSWVHVTELRRLEVSLDEIIELVGEGGDGTAFGSVESMMSEFSNRLHQAVAAFHDATRLRMEIQKARIRAEDELAAVEKLLPRKMYVGDLTTSQNFKNYIAELIEERNRAAAEARDMRKALETAGERLKAHAWELTEFAYQELASVLFDLPTQEGS